MCAIFSFKKLLARTKSYIRKLQLTWRARVSSSKSWSWTLIGAACDTSLSLTSESLFMSGSKLLEAEASAAFDLVVLLRFLLGVTRLMASWKRIARNWSNCDVTEWSFSLKIRTCSIKENNAYENMHPHSKNNKHSSAPLGLYTTKGFSLMVSLVINWKICFQMHRHSFLKDLFFFLLHPQLHS